jgi:hypothetical protein
MKKIILPLFSFARPNRKSTNEGRGCKYFTLKNGMKVLVVEDFYPKR